MGMIMFVSCLKREVRAIADEFEDWKQEGLEVRLYGMTAKAIIGFLLLAWHKPIPEQFFDKLKDDEDILDYLIYEPAFEQPKPA